MNAFESNYLKELEDTYTRFNNVIIQNILTYLYQCYGKVTLTKLEEAEKTFLEFV